MREWLDTRTIVAIMVGLAVVRLSIVGWRSDTGVQRQVTELLDSALLALVLMFVVIRPFVAQSFFIPTPSMDPALRVGDWVLTNRLVYRINSPERGDVVVFRAPQRALEMSSTSPPDGRAADYIKRVVGLPGDWVEVRPDRGVYINGRLLRESYIARPTHVARYVYRRTRVPAGHLFVMGDNRNNSNDSHAWGPLPADLLVGKAMVIFWPPTRAGWLN